MTEFNLALAHPDYRSLIERVIIDLTDRYPWVPLRAIRIYEPKSGDTSLGNDDTPGVISLNAHWFGQPPSLLQSAALILPIVTINGREVWFHGAMVEEPVHVLTHEFAHSAQDAIPDWYIWAHGGWLAALADPGNAVSGYALSDPAEFFAEMFAAAHLNFADPKLIDDLMRNHA